MLVCDDDACVASQYAFRAGDIWSENGIAMFALTAYIITPDFKFKELLLHCAPFTKTAHSGDEIKNLTLQILVCAHRHALASVLDVRSNWTCCLQTNVGVGSDEQEICDRIHGCTPDEGANMLKAWKIFEGSGCVCHRSQNVLKEAVDKDPDAQALFRKLKGIVAHFHRSIKVTAYKRT